MNCELNSTLLGEDVVDVAATAAKKDTILERLNKRNKDRQNYLDVKLEQRNKENQQLEGIDYFSQTFAERVREIDARIQNINEAAAKKTNGDASGSDLGRLFADITLELQDLQRYLTTSTMFLTDFKIKSCQSVLNELTSSCEDTRLRLMPKKKFGFSGRKVAPKAVVNPKVSAGDKLDSCGKIGLGTSSKVFSWTLSQRKDEHICLRGEEINGKDVTISNLKNCLVELQGHPGSLQISGAIDCVFLCGPIARSVFAEHCQSSTLALACQQFRLHSSASCRIYLHVTCRAIIEDCKQIEIANYSYDYPTIETDFQKAGLDRLQNNYADVADFNWLSPEVPSPNWTLSKDCPPPSWNEVRAIYRKKSTTQFMAQNMQNV